MRFVPENFPSGTGVSPVRFSRIHAVAMGSARVSRAVVVVSITTSKHQLFFHCLAPKEWWLEVFGETPNTTRRRRMLPISTA